MFVFQGGALPHHHDDDQESPAERRDITRQRCDRQSWREGAGSRTRARTRTDGHEQQDTTSTDLPSPNTSSPMSPRAAEARLSPMTRTISSGDLFAPKGGFACPAFNSLPHSLDFDLFDPDPANTSWNQMYSEDDGIDLSPLASSYPIPPLVATVRSPACCHSRMRTQ